VPLQIKPLRYVKNRWEAVEPTEALFLPEDHNDHVDNWKSELDFLKSANIGGDLLPQLESVLSSMRYVKDGDYYYAEDHNRFVRAFSILMHIIDSAGVTGDEVDELRNIVSQMRSIKAGDFYFADMHNLFARAWELIPSINERLVPPVPAWDVILDFDSWDDVKLFNQVIQQAGSGYFICNPINGEVSNSAFTFYGAPGRVELIGTYWDSRPPSKMEVVFKMNPIEGSFSTWADMFYFFLGDGTKMYGVQMQYPQSTEDVIWIGDCIAWNWYSIPYTTDWLRAVLDFDTGTFTIYDARGVAIFALQLTPIEQPWLSTAIAIGAANYDYYKASVTIDRIAVKFKDVAPRQNASGISPYDPTWMPADGWDIANELRSGDYVTYPFYWPHYYEPEYARIDEVLDLKAEVFGYNYTSVYFFEKNASRIALAFRLDLRTITSDETIIDIESEVPTKYIRGFIRTVANSTSAIALVDSNTGNCVTVPYNGDWVVAVFDFPSSTLRIYDRFRNVLGSIALKPDYRKQTSSLIAIIEDWGMCGNKYKIYVDWFAMRVAQCPRY